jgi:glycosyltransferase involved in cell wall biosynthesis
MTSAPHDSSKKLVLFHRDFQRFTGGHLKVWHYFNHVAAAPAHEPRIAFSPQSKWDETNPWFQLRDGAVEWQPEKADLLFLAGTDWRALPAKIDKPVINLIQHQRHAEPKSDLRGYLKNRAVRICVSAEVADAIKATGEVNGPVFTIPNGIDLGEIPPPAPANARKIDILICGLKAPELAKEVSTALAKSNLKTECITEWMPRLEFLARINDAGVTVFLPRPVEGFYLPPLEGMAAGTVVVCPDCEGNRGFCLDGVNCFRPEYDAAEIISAVNAALAQPEAEQTRMRQEATATVHRHSLASERESFHRILDQLDNLGAD